ncbi:MAG: hypothetical protein IH571_02430 [Acholeplasmataceae bacterium]|nr:hypothetical protein [Acholeplasmataceae bacterium]
MTKHEVLNQLHKNEINPKRAYRLLYSHHKERKPRKAHFVKIGIRIPESRGISILLAILFILPIYIGLIKLLIKIFAKNGTIGNSNLTAQDLIDLVSVRGVKVNINASSGEKVLIRTL